jgi:hypothetical protein
MVFSRRWCRVQNERVRIEIGFDGGQALSLVVDGGAAEAFEQAVAGAEARSGAGEGAVRLDADDGVYTIALRQVTYVRRFLREARVGFGA